MSPSAVVTKKSYSIASIPADGIGPEVISAGVEVLNALAETLQTFDLDFTHYDWSSDTYKKTGKYIPDGGLEQLKKHDAILFGAVGAPGRKLPLCTPKSLLTAIFRCPRSHLPMGSSSSNLSALSAIRQRATNTHNARNPVPPKKLQNRRSRLGHHP
jgi:isocitrate dehydrogenase